MAKRKKENEDQENINQNSSDDSADNFGLPDIEYKPLDRTEPEPRETFIEPEKPVETFREEENPEPPENYYEEEESTSKAPYIIGIGIVLVILVASYLIWQYVYVPRQAEKAKKEQLEKEKIAADKKAEEERLAREAEEAEKKRLADEAVKAKPSVGTIETLSDRTRRYYVVLSSDIDDDLIMDYAKRLSVKGVSTKIVPPYGSSKFFRLTMAGDFASYSEAQASADASKAEYGGTLWVLYY